MSCADKTEPEPEPEPEAECGAAAIVAPPPSPTVARTEANLLGAHTPTFMRSHALKKGLRKMRFCGGRVEVRGRDTGRWNW